MNRQNVENKFRIIKHIRSFLEAEGFIEIFPTRIGNYSATCEHPETLFPIDYYGQIGYLSQTAQPILEEFALELGKCYSITPCFRKEICTDNRHLSEFWHIEAEWITSDIEDVLHLVEKLLTYIIDKLDVDVGFTFPLKRINFSDISSKNEIDNETNPYIVKYYPIEEKWFNFSRVESDINYTKSADLIFPQFGELLGAGIRSNNVADMKRRLFDVLTQAGCPDKDINFKKYLDMKAKFRQETGGFGIGLERLMMALFNLTDIRKTEDSEGQIRNFSTKL